MVNSTGNCWGMLPEEIQMEIVGKLGFKGLAALSEVNTLFNRLANDKHLGKRMGQEIGLTGRDFENNPRSAIKKEVEKIKDRAIVAGIEKPSLNTPDEINHVKLQIDYEGLQKSDAPHNTPPKFIQKLLNDPVKPENLAKLERWLQARSTVIVYEELKRENNNLTDLDAGPLEGDKWEGIFNSYAEWSEENQNELQNIIKLNLNSMMILRLRERIFDGLESLKGLNLRENQLSELPKGIFDGLKSLKNLYLSGNQLSVLPKGIFDGLESLKNLHLSGNQLSVLPKGIFDGLKSLKELYLSFNQLSELPNLDELESLKELNLSYNQLSELPPNIFNKLARLEYLNLSTNQLSELPNLDELKSLKELNLSYNQLSELPRGIFDGLKSLVVLWLCYNQLSELPRGIFDQLESIENLWLSYNQLSELPEGAFDHLENHVMLNLRGNKIDKDNPTLQKLPDRIRVLT